MPSFIDRIPAALLLFGATSYFASAQMPSAAPAGPRVEPGLEVAVKWIWKVEPSPLESWGLPLPDFPTPPPAPPPVAMPGSPGTFIPRATLAGPQARPDVYTVKKGDSLYVIGRRFKVSVAGLKQANGLTTNNIRVGLELKIPPPDALPPMAAPSPDGATAGRKLHKTKTAASAPEDFSTLTMQVFLDRQQFSVGPIDGQISPAMQKAVQLYQGAHPDLKDPAALMQKVQATVGDPIAQYTLKPEDFRFIAPPKAETPDATSAAATASKGKKHKGSEASVVHQPKATYHDLISSPMLAYRTPWEFVAERFHCNEAYLERLNPQVRGVPTFGTALRVPNVIPFEIENALTEPLQPQANPQEPVSATVVDLSRLEISQDGALIAEMPLSMARPGLKGKDAWTVLNAIPRPMLATMHELRVKPQPVKRMFGRDTVETAPTPTSTPVPTEDIIAAGPNNPVGIIWINLAKSGTTEPLPYGLHGTSIPDQMTTQQSLGGLRLTNWDIARAVHLLPPGTQLTWKTSLLTPPAPAAAAAAAPVAAPATVPAAVPAPARPL